MRKEFKDDVFEILRHRAQDVSQRARELAAVDTGAMRASIYISHSKGSNYNFALANAQQLRDFEEPPNERENPKSDLEVVVGVAAPYAGLIEFGHFTTGGTFVAARPFMGPAAEDAESLIIGDLMDMMEQYDNE